MLLGPRSHIRGIIPVDSEHRADLVFQWTPRHADHHGGFLGSHWFWNRYSAGSRPSDISYWGGMERPHSGPTGDQAEGITVTLQWHRLGRNLPSKLERLLNNLSNLSLKAKLMRREMMLGPSHSRRASDQLLGYGDGSKVLVESTSANQLWPSGYHPGTIRVPSGYQGFDSSPYGSSSKDLVLLGLCHRSPTPSLVKTLAPFEVTIIYQYFEMFYKVPGSRFWEFSPSWDERMRNISRWTFRTRGLTFSHFGAPLCIWPLVKPWFGDTWNGLIFIVCIVLMIVAIFTNF